ncbi:hypothetical protein [Paenisporosarcina indica]|uniref:hypothetical protein n=1 Tax=Paenisporosarcina indica TaxID=650093 RepID=UPI001FE70491|nr:hypothetical protein [Paenisporosarcina indica]
MVIVAVMAMWYLNKEYTDVPFSSRILIVIGGTLVSGIISFFLMKKDVHHIDDKPTTNTLKKR